MKLHLALGLILLSLSIPQSNAFAAQEAPKQRCSAQHPLPGAPKTCPCGFKICMDYSTTKLGYAPRQASAYCQRECKN